MIILLQIKQILKFWKKMKGITRVASDAAGGHRGFRPVHHRVARPCAADTGDRCLENLANAPKQTAGKGLFCHFGWKGAIFWPGGGTEQKSKGLVVVKKYNSGVAFLDKACIIIPESSFQGGVQFPTGGDLLWQKARDRFLALTRCDSGADGIVRMKETADRWISLRPVVAFATAGCFYLSPDTWKGLSKS